MKMLSGRREGDRVGAVNPLSRRALLGGALGISLSAAASVAVGGCERLSSRSASRASGRVAILHVGDPLRVDALRLGLRELGWVEGQNLTIVERVSAGTEEWLPGVAAELVRLADVVVVGNPQHAQAITTASLTTPIVFWTISNPVGNGLVASLARPGGYATGLYSSQQELQPKRVEILKHIAPGVSRVGVLFDPGAALNSLANATAIEDAAQQLGIETRRLEVRRTAEVAGALERAVQDGVDGLDVIQAPVTFTPRAEITRFAAAHHLPAIYTVRAYIEAGGLVCYGPDMRAMAHRSAYFVDKILRGTSPGDLPMEGPRTYEFLINVPQLAGLGLSVPSDEAAQVTEWIT